jgi:hypothetical protein
MKLRRTLMALLASVMLLTGMAVSSQSALAYTTKQLEVDCASGNYQGSGTLIRVYGWNQNNVFIDGSQHAPWTTNGYGIIYTYSWWW